MELFSRQEASAYLGVGLTTLDNLRLSGKIGYLQQRPGCKVQFTKEHLDKYLTRVERKPKEFSVSGTRHRQP